MSFLSACERPLDARTSMSPEKTVVVFADAVDWSELEEPIRALFEEPIETPREESIYKVRRESPADFEFFSQFAMILIAGTHDRWGEAFSLLRPHMTLATLADDSAENGWLRTKRDLWAHPQLVGVLSGESGAEIRGRVLVQGTALRDVYDSFVRERVADKILRRTQSEAEERAARETGIKVPIPRRWLIRDFDRDHARVAIWKRRKKEDWQLLVQAMPGASERGLRERCRIWRDAVIGEVYDGDLIRSEGLKTDERSFEGRPGVRLRGLWENRGYVMGGPFETWCIPDPAAHRTLLVDMSVYAPGESKMEGLRTLQTLASRVELDPRWEADPR
ncbi:MAG: hypothetical protein CME06_12390 [Gemmatimonadetes bacterium]|nr:hypothetical protein [Gemmatimonadota bacterium]